MVTEAGWASLGIIPTFGSDFDRKLEAGTSRGMSSAGSKGGLIFGDAAGKSAGSRFGSLFKSAAKASLIGLAGAGALAVKVGADSISAASDLEESTNKVKQIFGDAADEIFRFSRTSADALGQTNTQAREAASTFGTFAKAAGLGDQKSAKFAQRMTVLASDLASFHNTDPDEAVLSLGAALRGEAEPIRKYGVLLDEATLKAEALALGILKPVKNQAQIQQYQVAVTSAQKAYNDAVKEYGDNSLEVLKAEASLGTARDRLQKATEGTIPPLTQQQKLLAAQSQIFKQTGDAQGDFARTSDGLANQQRRLTARLEDAKAELGKGLLPIMSSAADFVLDEGIPAFEKFADWFTKDGIPKLKRFGSFAKEEIVPVLEDVADFAGDAAEHMGDLIKWVNDLPKPAKYAGLVALLGAVGATKLRGGSGKLGAAGSVLGLSKPVPVFVTNPGFGSGTGGTGDKGSGIGSSIGKALGAFAVADVLKDFLPSFSLPFDDNNGNQGFLHSIPGLRPGEPQAQFDRLADRWDFTGIFADNEKAAESFLTSWQKDITNLIQGSIKPTRSELKGIAEDIRDLPAFKLFQMDLQSSADRNAELILEIFSGQRSYAKESQSADAMLPAPSRTTRRGKSSGGVNVNIGTVKVNDAKDLERSALGKAQQAAMGGFGI